MNNYKNKKIVTKLLLLVCAFAVTLSFVGCNNDTVNDTDISQSETDPKDISDSQTPARPESTTAADTGHSETTVKPEPTTPADTGYSGTTERPEPTAYDVPLIIENEYESEEIIIADAVVTDPEYGADPTGEKDSRLAIQRAISDVAEQGGGTVYIPAGRYRVTDYITVRAFVTLQGDYVDPDKARDGDYGTLIIADVDSRDTKTPGLFSLRGSSGVVGLTVFYPQQDLDDVKPYPFTFYVPGWTMLQTVKNCTVINGYRGIGATILDPHAHEMLYVENLKGTFLRTGAHALDQSDVGTWKNIEFNNRFWAEAGEDFNAPNRSELDTYTRNNARGLVLGDLEWTQFYNVKLSGFNIGLHIVEGKRIEFAGAFYEMKIEDCETGILIDSIDERWGMVVSNSSISGS